MTSFYFFLIDECDGHAEAFVIFICMLHCTQFVKDEFQIL